MMERLIAALGKQGLTVEEIADAIWLASQMQQAAQKSSPIPLDNPILLPTVNRPLNIPLNTEPSTSPISPSPINPPPPSSPKDESPPSNPQTQTSQFGIYAQQKGSAAVPFKVPDAPSLREPLNLARAMRSLMRRVPSTTSTAVLDEAATTQRIAEEGIWMPVLKPTVEPWLEVALVVDESESMLIWRHTVVEFQRLLEHYGGFRDVRTWGLFIDNTGKVKIRSGIGLAARNQCPRSPKELIEPNGRRLILIASDCIAKIWQKETVLDALKIWAESGQVAIVQMLPQYMWEKTALGLATEVLFRTLEAGVPNQRLLVKQLSAWDDIDLNAGIKVPVVTLEPEKLSKWAQMVTGRSDIWRLGYVFEGEPVDESFCDSVDSTTELFAEKRLQRFRVTASPMARKLAVLLAAAPVICLPVVRIIQAQMLPESRQVHVAEVFLGGLLTPLSEIRAETNPDSVEYDFMPGVRDILLESIPALDSLDVIGKVSEFVANRLGVSLAEFAAVLKNPAQAKDEKVAQKVRPFAMVTAQVLKRMGGEYARIAEQLENQPTKTILILAANPKITSPLRLEAEIREIDEGLRRANKREQYKLEQKLVLRSRDFYRAILDYQPNIVHFCGHGAGEDGIVLEDDTGKMAIVPTNALASMFKLFAKKGVECVIFNACYSEVQAEAISQYVNYVIGTNKAVGDKAAVAFAVAFYDGIAAGCTVEEAYELGCSQMMSFGEQETPVFKKKNLIDAPINKVLIPFEYKKLQQSPVKTILILAANHKNTASLRLDEEIREIDEGLRRENKREQYKLEQKWAVRYRDFYRAILDYQPNIVHFCGHGAGEDGIVLEDGAREEGIVLEDDTGKMAIVPTNALASMFKLFAKKGVECVIFNACYSEVQAEAISQYVNYVIGTNKAVGDKAAVAFAVAFYDGIAAGYTVENAYELGCSQMMSFGEHEIPVILKKKNLIDAPIDDIAINFEEMIPPNPYQGLAAFGEEDADFFFGQENFVNNLVEVTHKQPLVAVVGPSGSGKSSAVFAGLIPKLRKEGNWLIEIFRPGKEPFLPLASALVRQLVPEADETQQLREAVGLAEGLQNGRFTQQVVSRILERNSGKRLLLVADQFEELYTFCQVKEEQERFVHELLTAITQENLTLVLTLRADFLGYVGSYRPLRDALQEYTPQLLSSMKREELQAAIELPAQKLEVELEPQLTQRILDDVGQEPGNLPLLEFALTRLWEKQINRELTHQAYEEIGGVKKAIANHAEQVYQQLSERDKKQAQRIFVQLVRPGEGTEDTRRIATRAEVGEDNWNLVSYLAGYPARLVVTGRQEQEDTVEVVHEALIREWGTLREWIDANRMFRTWQERLKVALREWKNNNHDSGALLRGVPLTVAEDWLRKRADEMTQEERDFI